MNITSQIANDLSFILPESCTILGIVAFILGDLFIKNKKTVDYLFFFVLAVILALNIEQLIFIQDSGNVPVFFNHLLITAKACYLKCIVTFIAILYFIYKNTYNKDYEGELATTILSQLFGAFIVLQASSYITLFLGIETVSITSYIITYFGKTENSKVSSLKYFLFGAFSSGLMIYGISWMYGITGHVFINLVPTNNLATFDVAFHYLAIVCVYAGLLFKISAIPYHLWTEDVYKGIPNILLTLLSLIPKIVGLYAIYFLHHSLMATPVLGNISYNYLYIISIITMVWANFIALKQKQFKSLFAFSSIAQSGLMLAFIPNANIENLLFYISFYILMNIGLLYIFELFSGNEGDAEVKALSGRGQQQTFLGILLLVTSVSLIGIPPFVGFMGKFIIVDSLFSEYLTQANPLPLAVGITVVLTTFLSLFYYLQLPYYLFIKPSEKDSQLIITNKQVLFSAFLVLPLVIGFFSFDWLLQWLQHLK